ncbi:MFS transporter [Cellulomonas sp. ATA003]|uniref:MFS transporter n=1 Tax=Cellulomonas sp. ATA003 TaxID=3073064 RepID=UPI0028730EB3|nr:MFS transporter [Cellulomonas sp. ATA003]WNB85726.1 MFS transporter [Cellulomonas sp. ATA003]
MPSVSPLARTVEPRLRRARAAVAAVFFLNAVVYANLVPRLPDLKDRLDLTNAELGAAVAAMPAGALLAGLLAPALLQRLGSAKVGAFGLIGLAVAVAGVPLTGSWAAFAALLLVAGALDAVIDVAQNAHAFRVQRAYGRFIVNSLHATWSIGAVVGGLLGSAAAGLAIPLGVHLWVSAAVFSVVALLAYRSMLPGPDDTERTPPAVGAGAGAEVPSGAGRRLLGHVTGRTVVLLVVLGLLASAEGFAQDAGSTWGALYMRGEVGTSAAVAGLAFVALQVAMVAGRLVGDRVIDRVGQRRAVRVGGAVTAVGMGLAIAVPAVPTTLVGFALTGLGVATLVPAVMHAADELPGLPHGVGLSVASWLLRVGFLLSPAIIGVVADASSLRVGLVVVVLAGVTVVVLGRVLSARDPD